jgi:hypothetical protein
MIDLLLQNPGSAADAMARHAHPRAAFLYVCPYAYDLPGREKNPRAKSNILLLRPAVTIGYIDAPPPPVLAAARIFRAAAVFQL